MLLGFVFNVGCPCFAAQIAICTTTADNADTIKRWMRYHQILGVTHFYLFLEGQA